jgi:hypothetical protein
LGIGNEGCKLKTHRKKYQNFAPVGAMLSTGAKFLFQAKVFSAQKTLAWKPIRRFGVPNSNVFNNQNIYNFYALF